MTERSVPERWEACMYNYQNERFLQTLPRIALDGPDRDRISVCRIDRRRVVVGVRVSREGREYSAHKGGVWRVTLAGNGVFIASASQLAQTDYFLFPAPVVLYPRVNAEIMLNVAPRGTRVDLLEEPSSEHRAIPPDTGLVATGEQ